MVSQQDILIFTTKWKLNFSNHLLGKSGVKLLHIKRDGPVHSIQELEVNTQLTLATKKDYLVGDNSDIVATDSQKNTVYILAKKHGVTSPEAFAIILCRHFIGTYSHVLKVQVHIEQYPWQRAQIGGKEHNHAFVFTPVATRVCTVRMERNGLSIYSLLRINLWKASISLVLIFYFSLSRRANGRVWTSGFTRPQDDPIGFCELCQRRLS